MANENNEYFGKGNEQNASNENVDLTNDAGNQTDVTTTTPEKHNNTSTTGTNVQTTMDEAIGLAAACTSVKLNDLVADLCITSTTANATVNTNNAQQTNMRNNVLPANTGSYGDYTNIRATTSTPSSTRLNDVAACVADSSTENMGAAAAAPATHAAPVQNSSSSFSFKHFLNSSNSVTAPSTTVTSLDPVGGASGAQCAATTTATATATATGTPTATATGTMASSFSTSSSSLQTSTGARPKVPQSVSVSATMHGSGMCSESATSKMKRSPRFSSFDSQASLAEYTGAPLDNLGCGFVSCSLSRRGELDVDDTSEADYFSTTHYSSMRTSASSSIDYDARQYVPRSQSNFDLQSSSPRRRAGGNMSARPTRLALNYISAGLVSSTSVSTKMKLDLPFEASTTNYTGPPTSVGTAGLHCNRQQAGCVNDYPPAAAAALPDFVQDHWMDSWYTHDVHLSSPPNSPINDFPEDLIGAAGSTTQLLNANADAAAACLHSNEAIAAAVCGGAGAIGNNLAGASCSSSAANDATIGSKMLPDFLSDGPIIHSSQRLADVAVGLPSNSMGSPDESHMTAQLSRLLGENERLQREMHDLHVALQKQTRRANELERQQLEQQRHESCNAAEKQKSAKAEEQILKLQQQVASMRGEIERLRRENELLREEGAVGGAVGATGTAAGASGSTNARNSASRPSKQQQQQQQQQQPQQQPQQQQQQQNLSRDLRMAATTAETHLRQLLAGVDNLRQMATQIENADCVTDYNVSPDLFTDFPDNCYDYDEYSGPAS